MDFNPHVVVIGLKFAFYEKTQSGLISPSAKIIKSGAIKIEGVSLEDCQKKVEEFIKTNKVGLL